MTMLERIAELEEELKSISRPKSYYRLVMGMNNDELTYKLGKAQEEIYLIKNLIDFKVCDLKIMKDGLIVPILITESIIPETHIEEGNELREEMLALRKEFFNTEDEEEFEDESIDFDYDDDSVDEHVDCSTVDCTVADILGIGDEEEPSDALKEKVVRFNYEDCIINNDGVIDDSVLDTLVKDGEV